MATITGMDIPAVRALAKELKSGSTEIETLVKKLTTKIESAPWVGADYTKFKGDWNGTHAPAMRKAADALKTVGTTAEKNATEQEQTSSR